MVENLENRKTRQTKFKKSHWRGAECHPHSKKKKKKSLWNKDYFEQIIFKETADIRKTLKTE